MAFAAVAQGPKELLNLLLQAVVDNAVLDRVELNQSCCCYLNFVVAGWIDEWKRSCLSLLRLRTLQMLRL